MVKQNLIPPISYALVDPDKSTPTTAWWRFFQNLGNEQDVVAAADIASSYPTGLTITGVAATATASISAYTRQFPSGAVAYPAGSVAHLAYGASYWLYFDDGAYHATMVAVNAFASAAHPQRLFIGALTMPANAGAADTMGVPAAPPGYVAP